MKLLDRVIAGSSYPGGGRLGLRRADANRAGRSGPGGPEGRGNWYRGFRAGGYPARLPAPQTSLGLVAGRNRRIGSARREPLPNIHISLRPEGVLLDLHPQPEPAPVEVCTVAGSSVSALSATKTTAR